MNDNFSEKLEAARAAGQEAAKRTGQSIKALTLRKLDDGLEDPVDIWRAVLRERGELPPWLEAAPAHELGRALSAWTSVRHTMRGHKA